MKTSVFTSERRSSKGRHRTLNDEELAAFCGELAVLMSSGLDLIESLKTFTGGKTRRVFQTGVSAIIYAVKRGAPLSAAMGDSAIGLPELVIETLRVGETSGQLVPILEQLEAHYDRRSCQKNKLIQIMIYPAIVLVMTLAVTRYLVNRVLPSLINTLSELNLSMTAGTRMLISLNGAMANVLLAAAVVFAVIGILHKVLPEGWGLRVRLDHLLLETPVFGQMRRLENWAAYLDMLVLALNSGVDLITALTVSARPVANAYFKVQLSRLSEMAGRGVGLAEGFAQTGLLDEGGERLIKVGEKSGALLPMLKKAGTRYRKQYDRRFARMSSVMEPALIVIVGVLVGCVVVSFISLLYTIYGGYAAMM